MVLGGHILKKNKLPNFLDGLGGVVWLARGTVNPPARVRIPAQAKLFVRRPLARDFDQKRTFRKSSIKILIIRPAGRITWCRFVKRLMNSGSGPSNYFKGTNNFS